MTYIFLCFQLLYPFFKATTQCTHQQKPPSCEVIETLNLSRVRQHDKSVVIQQQSLVWPSFGITKTSFKGLLLLLFSL